MRWNDGDQWICSDKVVHPPLVDDETFDAVPAARSPAGAAGQHRHGRTGPGPYALRGLLYCGLCDRRMQGQLATTMRALTTGAPSPPSTRLANHVHHPRNVYLREDAILARLDSWLSGKFDPGTLAADDRRADRTPRTAARDRPTALTARPRREIADCDRKLARVPRRSRCGRRPRRSSPAGSPRSRPSAPRPRAAAPAPGTPRPPDDRRRDRTPSSPRSATSWRVLATRTRPTRQRSTASSACGSPTSPDSATVRAEAHARPDCPCGYSDSVRGGT